MSTGKGGGLLPQIEVDFGEEVPSLGPMYAGLDSHERSSCDNVLEQSAIPSEDGISTSPKREIPVAPSLTRPTRRELPTLTATDVGEILGYVPSRPPYSEWVRIISAVAAVLDPAEAATVLSEWSPEERPGEYSRKLRSPCTKVGIGSLIDIAKKNGFDASAFTKRRAEGCVLQSIVPRLARRIIAPTTPPPAKKLPKYTARPGTAVDLETLAKLRKLGSVDGLGAMQEAGCLAFANDLSDQDDAGNWYPVPSWLTQDPTRRNVSARRLDGLPWRCIGEEKSRCVSGIGSKGWPVGITLAKPGQRLDVVEGEGDFVALWHLHALAGTQDAAPVGLLGSCANFDGFAPEIAPFVTGRTVLIFAHRDVNRAGQDAAEIWATSFYRLGADSVRVRNLSAWLDAGGKDLNDAIAGDTARRRATIPEGLCPACFARHIIAPLNGPTCSCVPYDWSVFTAEEVAAEEASK